MGARGSRSVNKKRGSLEPRKIVGADNGARTRDPNLGKVVLYQLSHVRLRVINLRELSKRRKYFFQKKLPAACSWWLNALKRLARHAIPVLR